MGIGTKVLGQGGNIVNKVWGFATGWIDSGAKEAIEKSASADANAAKSLLKDYFRLHPDATPTQIEAFKASLAGTMGAGTSATQTALKEGSLLRKFKNVAIVGGIAGVLAGTGLAEGALTSGMTAWENSERRAGVSAWFEQLLAFAKQMMRTLGLDKTFPGAYKWLGDSMDDNNGPVSKIPSALETMIPNQIDLGSKPIAAGEATAAVLGAGGVGVWGYNKVFGKDKSGLGGKGGGDIDPTGGARPGPTGPKIAAEVEEGAGKSTKGFFARAAEHIAAHPKLSLLGLGATVAAGATYLMTRDAKADELGAEQPTAPITTSATAPAAEVGIVDQSINFAKGLYEDAKPANWSLGNAANLANAGAHGLVDGTAYMGSFAYANTIGWFTGQSTEEVHKEYVGAAVNAVWDRTVGAPDLSGHWAQAVHFAGEIGLPSKAAGMGAIKLFEAFNLAEKTGFMAKTARFGIRAGVDTALVPMPGGPS